MTKTATRPRIETIGADGEGKRATFARAAAVSAFAVAVLNLAYSVSFLIVRPDNPDAGGAAASAFLLAGGLLALPALLALYRLVRPAEPDLALLATVLATAGALGAAIHGGYDLANAINPPDQTLDLPNQVDPRGLLTFGVSGLALLLCAPLLRRTLAPLAVTLGALLIALYVLRLVVLDAESAAIVVTAALVGLRAQPALVHAARADPPADLERRAVVVAEDATGREPRDQDEERQQKAHEAKPGEADQEPDHQALGASSGQCPWSARYSRAASSCVRSSSPLAP